MALALSLTVEEQEAAERLVSLALVEDLRTLGDITSRALIRRRATGHRRHCGAAGRCRGGLAGGGDRDAATRSPDDDSAPGVRRRQSQRRDDHRTGPRLVALAVGGRAHRPQLPDAPEWRGHANPPIRRSGRRHQGPDPRNAEDVARLAALGKIRRPRGRRHQSSDRPLRRLPDQGQPLGRLARSSRDSDEETIRGAVAAARSAIPAGIPLEIEVDTLDQLKAALAAAADIVLLDNMDAATIGQAVRIRDELAPRCCSRPRGALTWRQWLRLRRRASIASASGRSPTRPRRSTLPSTGTERPAFRRRRRNLTDDE